MEGSYTGKLRVWHDGIAAVVQDVPEPGPGSVEACRPASSDAADRLYVSEALTSPAARLRPDPTMEPYTLQWFLSIESHRHGRTGRWIPRLLEFSKHAGETLLGLGHGLGTDWLQYARNGTFVLACSPSSEQLTLIRRNFELRGLPGRFLHASPAALPLDNACIDVACVSSLLHQGDDSRAVVDEVYRVLKPGGKVLAVVPARFDVDFWRRVGLPWQHRRAGRWGAEVATPRYSGRSLRRLFDRYVEHRVYKRQLRRSEVPHVWRWAPLPVLERLLGRVLVLKAFKPLSAAIGLQAAA